MIARSAIVSEARRWLTTPYHHEADILGVGVDCAMILVRVFAACGAIPADFDPRPYPADWMLHRNEERYLGWLADFADPLGPDDRVLPADIPVWRFGRTFSHAAIATDDLGNVIHAFRPAGMVTTGHVRELIGRDRQVWRVRGLEDA